MNAIQNAAGSFWFRGHGAWDQPGGCGFGATRGGVGPWRIPTTAQPLNSRALKAEKAEGSTMAVG
jgi:hypothetical protein